MKKSTKIWLVIAAVLVLIGCFIFVGVMAMLKWDFTKLSTNQYETNFYETVDEFSNVSVETDTARLTFETSDDGKCRVECFEESNAKHSVSVEDNTLVIKCINNKSWYDHIGINFGTPKITVYLPETQYATLSVHANTGDFKLPAYFSFECIDISLSTGDIDCFASASEQIKIRTSTGKIKIQNVSAGSLDLSTSTGRITASNVTCAGDAIFKVTTGKVTLTDLTCKNLSSTGNTGDASLYNVIVKEKLTIARTTGDVRFEHSDAGDILVKTDTGSVTGSLLSDKVFLVQTNTGDIDIPQTASGGKCEIRTDTGDVRISVE